MEDFGKEVTHDLPAPFEVGSGLMQDLWRGDLGDAITNPVKRICGAAADIAAIGGQAIGNVAGNMTGQHEPSRGLRAFELAADRSRATKVVLNFG